MRQSSLAGFEKYTKKTRREISAAELYNLAEELSGLPAAILNINYYASMRAIAA